MPYPSRYISNSDLSSTPSSLDGAKTITLVTPANVYVSTRTVVTYQSAITFAHDFDTVDFILTCDQYPDINVYNGYIQIYGVGGVTFWASVEIVDNVVRLVATYSSFWNATFPDSLTIRAVVVPLVSPFSQ